MKKKTLLLSAALLAGMQLFAQSRMKPVLNWNDGPHKFIKNLLLSQSSHFGSKTTIPAERLASSDYDWSMFTTFEDDSLRYIYNSSTGTSMYDYNEMKYVFPTTPYDYDIPMANISFYVPATMAITCDTAYGKDKDTLGIYQPSRTTYAQYDVNKNLLSYYSINQDTANFPDRHYVNSFDASNRIVSNTIFLHPASTWDTSGVRYFTYNGSGQLTQDSLFTYISGVKSPDKKYVYTYDVSGRPASVASYAWNSTGSSWFHDLNYDMSYYGTGNLQSILISEDTGTGMFPAIKDSLGYTAPYSYFTSYSEFQYTDTGRIQDAAIKKHIGSNGFPDSVNTIELVYFYTGSGVIAQDIYFSDYYYYNSHNNPVAWLEYINFGSGYRYNSLENYFYEPLTAVANVAAQYGVTIYPNPASDIVNLKLSTAAIGKNITISITNTLGQLVKTQSAVAQNNMQVSISDLAPGTYLIYVRETNGDLWRIQKLVKQ